MIRPLVRRSHDVRYLTQDRADELDGPRAGPATWWPLGVRGDADPSRVLDASARGSFVGLDLVVAAARPVSCLVAVGTPAEQRAAVAAHRVGVRDALTYLEQRALVVRRRVLGETDELSGTWPAVVGFTHGVNRAGEPHLHDHVLVGARTAQYPQTIDRWSLARHLGAADALYRASVRHELGVTTTRTLWRSFRGVEYVSGLDEGLRALWPGRANDRAPKRAWRRDEIVRSWGDDLVHYEPGPVIAVPSRSRDALDEHVFGAALEGLTSIRRPDLVRAWADAATFGTPASDVAAAVDHWYPELRGDVGRSDVTVTLARARRTREVREHGARALLVERDAQSLARSSSRERPARSWER